MLQTLQIISLIIGVTNSLFIGLVALCKPFRNWFLERYRGRETDKCLLRDRITHIYYKYHTTQKIPQYDYDNLDRLYQQYKKLGGNSFVDKIWAEIQDQWEVTKNQ